MESDRRADLESAAIEWYVRVTSDDVSNSERDAFEAWLESDPANRDAYEDLQSMLEQDFDPTRDAVLRSEGLVPQKRRRGRRVERWGVWAAAAVVVLALVGAWLFQSGPSQTILTDVAERRSVALADGSTVHLNARSQISVALSGSTRRVRLEQGEVLFEVAAEEDRPFLVETGGGVIRVVGTQFNVRTDSEGSTVTVLEGVVEVAVGQANRSDETVDLRQLRAGQQLRYSSAGEVGDARKVDPERVTAWREGRLAYRGEPLDQVLRDLNRYVPDHVLWAESGVRDLRVSGDFYLDEIDGALEALEVALPIRSVRIEGLIVFVPESPE